MTYSRRSIANQSCHFLEEGEFLALDLGGTNFRVLRIQINKNGRGILMDNQVYKMPAEVMTGTGEEVANIRSFACYRDCNTHLFFRLALRLYRRVDR